MSNETRGDITSTQQGLADDLLLVLFQPDSGTIAGENTLFYVLAGAVLADMALKGYVRAEDAGIRGTLVHPIRDSAPDDELLRQAWEYVSEKPRGVQTVLAAIGPQLRGPLLDRLVDTGELHRTRGKVLGFIPTEKLEDRGTGRRERLVAAIRATLVDGRTPDARTAALVALLSASGTLPLFDREIPWSSEVFTRGKEIERGEWGAKAASAAVTRTIIAVTVNAVIAANVAASRS